MKRSASCGAEHAALKPQAALRILGQLIVILRARRAEIALGIHVQPDRPENRLGEVGPQERQGDVLVQVVDTAQRGRLAAVVQQVADVVQQRSAYQVGRGAGLLGEMRALQRVLELRDALALVGSPAFHFVEIDYLLDYHGIE